MEQEICQAAYDLIAEYVDDEYPDLDDDRRRNMITEFMNEGGYE